MEQKELIEIYKTISKDVFRYAMFMLKDKEKAEDVTSEVFARFIKDGNKNNLTGRELKNWFIGITRNVIYEHVREDRSFDNLEEKEEFLEEPGQTTEESLSEELTLLIKEELEKIKSIEKDVIALKVWQDMTFGEISKVLKVSENTTKALYYRGLQKLKTQLALNEQAKVRVTTLPVLLLGINQIAKHTEFIPSTQFLSKIGEIVLNSNLFLNISNMTNQLSQASTLASTVGLAGNTAKATFLSTTLGKVVVGGVASAIVIGGSVGGVLLINQDDTKDVEQNIEEVVSYPQELSNIPGFQEGETQPVVDEYASWKEQVIPGILTFKYPANRTINENDPNFFVSYIPDISKQIVDIAVDARMTGPFASYATLVNDFTNEGRQIVAVNGGIRYETGVTSDGSILYGYLFKRGEGAVGFSYTQYQSTTDPDLETFEKIVRSIVWSDDPTANWSTYTNDAMKVSFRYPSYLTVKLGNDNDYVYLANAKLKSLVTIAVGKSKDNLKMYRDGNNAPKITSEIPDLYIDGQLYKFEGMLWSEGARDSLESTCLNEMKLSNFYTYPEEKYYVGIDKAYYANCNSDGTQTITQTSEEEVQDAIRIVQSIRFLD